MSPVKEKKTYGHIRAIVLKALQKQRDVAMPSHVFLAHDDPRWIAKNVHGHDAPPTAVIAERKFSRF